MTDALDPSTWMDDAACARVDPDLFFPERGERTDLAKAVCFGCPVREECLEYALANNEKHGVWGGLSERQRRTLRSKRGHAHGGRQLLEVTDPRRVEQVLAMHAQGHSCREIGRQLDLNNTTVSKVIRRSALHVVAS